MSSRPTILWQYVPDVAGRRRLRSQVRFGSLGVLVVLVASAWWLLGVTAGLVAVLVMVLVTVAVEAWGRSSPDDPGPQRVWLDAGELCVEGADVYRRDPGDDGFVGEDHEDHEDEGDGGDGGGVDDQRVDAPMAFPLAALTDVAWASVYPATTRAEGLEGPPVGYHLVVDLGLRDGARRCAVFDRRIPFRVGGELALADAVRGAFGDRWRPPPPVEPFGEPDERRLGDWRAADGI